ncbi:MAG: transcriptional repressor LexA [Chloroflexota bacterium]|nr:transcriptional repressor LexA [Chloroflexota bacterium]
MTERQRRVLAVIAARIVEEGRPPTLREIGQELGIASTNGVRDHLQALIDKGYIQRDERSARGIRVLHAAGGVAVAEVVVEAPFAQRRAVTEVPVLGRVAAGRPVLAEQNIDGHLAVDRALVREGNTFALRVEGNSMRDAGILDGDYVFVRQQATAQPRDIVVALLDDETTVKRFVPAGDTIRLEAENPDFLPIIVPRGDPRLAILGKVSAVLRTIT